MRNKSFVSFLGFLLRILDLKSFMIFGQEVLPFSPTPLLNNGKGAIKGTVYTIVTAGFSANECFGYWDDLGPPVSEDYYGKVQFAFNGTINKC